MSRYDPKHTPTNREHLAKLDAFGVDQFCEWILDGKMQREIAEHLEITPSSVTLWIYSDEARLERIKEVKKLAAHAWDELAVETLRKAKTPIELGVARELAHHYRWRAGKINHREYGDRLKIDDETPKDQSILTTAQRIRAMLEEIERTTDGPANSPMDATAPASDPAPVLDKPA
jgi:hypothetical protein